MPHLLITGATGYVGNAVRRLAVAQGWTVTVAARRDPARPGLRWIPYDLGRPLDAQVLDGVDAILHLAAETRSETLPGLIPEAGEIAAAADLMARRPLGCRFIFVSSQSAALGAPTRYGRVKAAIEALCTGPDDRIVRPGLVYGGPEMGLFGRLCALGRRLPVVPALWPAPRVQPIHLDDLAQALLLIAQGKGGAGRFDLGAAEPVTFTAFWSALVRHRLRRITIPLPTPRLALEIAAPVLRRLGIETDRITALYALSPMDTRGSLERLGLTLRPLADGLRPEESPRRALATEGRLLFRHLGFPHLVGGALRRYVRAVEIHRDGVPLDLPNAARICPALLSLVAGEELRQRQLVALTIAEFTPEGAARLLPDRPTPLPLALLRLSLITAAEILWRVAALLAGWKAVPPGKEDAH